MTGWPDALGGGRYSAKQLAPDFEALSRAALAVASTDPAEGLALIDRLLAFGADVPEWAPSASALGYNRGALLGGQKRTEEALAAYQDVERRFRTNTDPKVQFWLALALYYHVSTLVHDGPDDVAARQVPALVAEMRDRLADHAYPSVRRGVRRAMQLEMQLHGRLGRNDDRDAAQARLHDLLRPAARLVVELIRADDPPSFSDASRPQWPTDLLDHVLVVMEDLDSIVDQARQLVRRKPDDRVSFVAERPVLRRARR